MATDNIFAEERKACIVEYVNQNTKATVAELCDYFHVSQATIRNDLKDLDAAGLISRVHGGAIANLSVNFERSVSETTGQHTEEKQAIAAAAIKYIHEGDAIALDAGTTMFEIATRLGIFHDLTVVTYDLKIASWLTQNTDVTVILAGGTVRKGFHYITGKSAVDTISDLHVDTAFMGCNGVDPVKGLTTPSIETADLKRVMMENANRSLLVADSSKLGIVSFVHYADLSDIDCFITDEGAPAKQISAFKQAGIHTETVPLGS